MQQPGSDVHLLCITCCTLVSHMAAFSINLALVAYHKSYPEHMGISQLNKKDSKTEREEKCRKANERQTDSLENEKRRPTEITVSTGLGKSLPIYCKTGESMPRFP